MAEYYIEHYGYVDDGHSLAHYGVRGMRWRRHQYTGNSSYDYDYGGLAQRKFGGGESSSDSIRRNVDAWFARRNPTARDIADNASRRNMTAEERARRDALSATETARDRRRRDTFNSFKPDREALRANKRKVRNSIKVGGHDRAEYYRTQGEKTLNSREAANANIAQARSKRRRGLIRTGEQSRANYYRHQGEQRYADRRDQALDEIFNRPRRRKSKG